MYESKKHREIDLVDLFFLMFRHLLVLFTVAFIGSIFGIAGGFLFEGSGKANLKYLSELRSFERNVEYKERVLADTEKELERKSNYISSSPFMELNADDIFSCLTSILIAPSAGSYTEVVPNPADIIGSAYIAYYNTLNLPKILGTDLQQEWLRECISVYFANNSIYISSKANNTTDAERLTATVSNILLDAKSTLAKLSFDHDTVVSTTTSHGSNPSVASAQSNHKAEKKEFEDLIDKQQEDLIQFKGKRPEQYHHLKYGALGFIVGGLIEVVILSIHFIFTQIISTSYSFEYRSESPFLGYIEKKPSLVDKISKERIFRNHDDAKSFMQSQCKTLTDYKSVAFVSSRIINDNLKNQLSSYLDAKTTVIDQAVTNPRLVDAVKESDLIILLEKPWVSKESDAKIINSIVERCGNKISGFVFFS